MKAFRVAGAVLIGGSAIMMWGCHSQQSGSTERQPAPDSFLAGQNSGSSGGGIPTTDPAELLAMKARSYAASLERAPAVKPAVKGEPSAVQWIDPGALTLGNPDVTPLEEQQARVNTVSAEAPLPNQAESAIAPKPKVFAKAESAANEPTILPESADNATANKSAQAAAAEAADPALRKYLQRIKDYPRDIAAHLDYQLHQFLNDGPTPDMAALSSLPQEDREVISALMDALNNFRNTVRADNNLLLSKKIKPLLELTDRLRSQADLTIPTATLCSSVGGFGNYEPIDPPRFAAGKPHPVILYCEVDNFSTQLNDKQAYETKLTQETVLYTETGLPVWPEKSKPTAISDTCKNRRHDFFVAQKITLPSNLTIGRYLLKVTIVDQQVSRVAEATVPIVIVSE